MKSVIQINYMFISCKHFKLAKKHTTSNSKHDGKKSGNMTSTISNLQHLDHKITKNDDTSSTP
jgi:hypothetical protein